MGSNFLAAKLLQYKAEIDSVGHLGPPMRFRLFGFFLAFLMLIMAGVLAVLFASGIFDTGYKESYAFLESELSNTAANITRDYSIITVHAIDLACRLSGNIERQLLENGVSAGSLQNHPDLLENLLQGQFNILTSSLEKTRSSGVLIILDATVNPKLEGSEHSRAGLFIKNMEPNIVSSSFSNLRLVRGPMSIARNNQIVVLPQWKMEFQVENVEYFTNIIETARNSKLPLSRLYYWSHGVNIASDTEGAMLCLVPLKDSKGHVFGVCGFEVSSMLFKLSYSPGYMMYNNIFCIFAPVEDGHMQVNDSLFAGSYRPFNLSTHPLAISKEKTFYHYKQTGAGSFAGLHQDISLYPSDSAYKEQWTLALMMQEQELARILSGQTKRLAVLLLLLVGISIVISAIVSGKYVKPVVEALDMMKSEKITQVTKTRIPEIDDLISFLAEQDEVVTDISPSSQEEPKQSSLLNQFVQNIDSLSEAERTVFDLYLKGHTAKEISEILFLSINTIKTHNKRIYMKLNVSSRKELMLYIQMLEETESELKD
jgi:DNA-binding CsgD family transcriptional regulator